MINIVDSTIESTQFIPDGNVYIGTAVVRYFTDDQPDQVLTYKTTASTTLKPRTPYRAVSRTLARVAEEKTMAYFNAEDSGTSNIFLEDSWFDTDAPEVLLAKCA